jgi:hypothetical protein
MTRRGFAAFAPWSVKPKESAVTTTSTKPTAASTGWRSILPIHPAAELFPPMSADELKALGEDIIKNGLTSPIVLWRAFVSGKRHDRRRRCR